MSERKPGLFGRRYLIDPRFQMKYTLLIVVLSAVVYGILGYKLYQKDLAITQVLQIQNLDLQDMVRTQDAYILYYLAGFFLLQVISLVVLGILITHRIAGPVYRVQRYLEEMAKSGDIKPMDSIRSKDEFHEFFESISGVINILKARTDVQRSKLHELQRAISEAKNDPTKMDRCLELSRSLLS
ncbi:MAG TPA: hypothetical protein VI895_09785 [Bdellovibrionota bacterium]|nr:hypothetical protein [Bdellovibrionota bacterium]